MNSPRVLIHIGVGKTGSTLFQKYIFAKHPDIEYWGGMRNTNKNSDNNTKLHIYNLLRAIVSLDSLDFDLDHWIKYYHNNIYVNFSNDKLNVISDEWLSVTPVSLVRGDRGLIAKRIYSIFSPEVKILVIIRNQLTVIKSLYLNHLNTIIPLYSRNGSNYLKNQMSEKSFKLFLLNTADYGILSKYRYFSLFRIYSKLFKSNFIFNLYEYLAEDYESFFHSLSSQINIDIDHTLSNFPKKKIKESKIKEQVGTFRKLMSRFNSQLNNDIQDSFSGFDNQKASLNEIDEEIFSYFKVNNDLLSENFDIPISKHGYPTSEI